MGKTGGKFRRGIGRIRYFDWFSRDSQMITHQKKPLFRGPAPDLEQKRRK